MVRFYFFDTSLSHLTTEEFALCSCVLQDVEIKEEGTRHMLILYNVRMNMAGGVDFSAANARSSAQLRVKGQSASSVIQLLIHLFVVCDFWFENVV